MSNTILIDSINSLGNYKYIIILLLGGILSLIIQIFTFFIPKDKENKDNSHKEIK